MSAPASTFARWRRLAAEQWAARAERERLVIAVAAALLVVALLWWVGFAPALRALRSAPAELDTLDGQLQQMRALAVEVAELRKLPAVPAAQAQAALATAAQRLGDKAVLRPQGARATVEVRALDGEELASWLAEVRASARARVVEAQLERTPEGSYRGKLVLALGGQA